MTNSSGVLYIWCAKSTDNKEHITPLLINAGIYYRYIDYKEGTIPSFSIDAEKDVVLALGGESKSPLQELKNYGLVKKNLTLASSRGIIYTLPCGVKCLTSYTALVRNVQYDLFVELQGDIKLAIRLLTTGSLIPPLLDFQWVDDFTEVIAAIDKHQFKWNSTKLADVAIDLETTGLIPYNPKTWIVTFQISTDEKSARVVKFADDFQPTKPENYTDLEYDASNCKNRKELLWVQINKLLNDQRVSLKGANLKFDLGWITEKWGIKCTNFRFDTLLVGSLLDENRSNSLKVHAFIYTPFGNYESDVFKKYNIAEPHKIPDDVLLPYCGYDTTVCLQVARKMKEELAINTKTYTNTNLRKFYTNILHPAARAYERVESTGLLVDKKYYLEFKKELEEKLESNLAKAHKYLPGRLISKFRDPKEPIKSVSLARAAMIADYMFGKQWLNLKPVMFTLKSTDENPKPSTALEHFLKFENDPSVGEFVKILKEYKDIAKTLSTYIDGFLADLRYDDRFHASFFMHKGQEGKAKDSGTNTGRLSIKGPALQTIPKKTKWSKPLRRAFIAPENYVLLSADYSQGELKILADLSQEPKMLWAYNNGLDLHAVTGAGLLGVPVDEFMSYNESGDPKLQKLYDENRQKAKGCNFGLCLKENQKVLTKHLETGIIALTYIQDVKLVHKLWDGLEWCNHDGILYKGVKEVIEYDGLTATPDHKIWLETGEVCTLEEAREANIKLAITGCEAIPITFNPIKSKFNKYSSDAIKRGNSEKMGSAWNLRSVQRNKAIQCGEFYKKETNPEMFLSSKYKVRQQSLCENLGGKIRYYYSALQQGYAQTITRLQWKRYSMSLYFQSAFYTLGFGNFPKYEFQEIGVRQDRQQGSLFSRKSTFSNQFGESSQYGEQCISYVSGSNNVLDGLEKSVLFTTNRGICSERDDRGANNRTGKRSHSEQVQELAGATTKTGGIGVLNTIRDYCASIYMAGETNVREGLGKPIQSKTNSGVSFSEDEWGTDYRTRQEVNKSEAEELASIGVPIKRVRVYDILNAGPRRRFTCEGKLVSNCYGMGAEGFKIYAETAYKVVMTLKEAEFYRAKFFETYQGLEPWYAKVKNLAKFQGYIDSPLGRRRHLPLLNSTDNQVASRELRRAVNSPVQGTLSDFSLWATAIAEKEGLTEKAPVVLMVHDQLISYLPRDNWVYYAKRYRDIMENLPFHEFGWEPKVKFTVDVEIGWGDEEKGIPPNLAQLTKASKLCKDWNN